MATYLSTLFHSGGSHSVLRDGFLGIGGSGAKTDRGDQLAGRQAQWNVFNQGLGVAADSTATGKEQQQTGQSNLTDASQYWKNLMSAGRTETADNAAPVINSAEAGYDAHRAQQAQFGTGRSGSTAAGNQQAETNKQSEIDNIINANLTGGKKDAAAGLTQIGGTELSAGNAALSRALSALGISGDAAEKILSDAAKSYQYTNEQSKEQGAAAGKAAAQIAMAFL